MINWEEIRREWESTKIALNALAEKHDIKLGTLKSRKSREGWSRDPTKKYATKPKKDATPKKKVATVKTLKKQGKRSGNPHPQNQFTKRNSAAVKHGFFAKYLPEETQEIMDAINEFSAADLIWDQIQIQYAAIIRAQRIMFVEDKGEMIKELKKAKYDHFEKPKDQGGGLEKAVTEEEYEFQFAWDRHATFLNAQSRAMGELRALIKQFDELAHIDDERRLKVEQMNLNIQKTKAEIEKINSQQGAGAQESEMAAMLRQLTAGGSNGTNS
ncbi:phage terminase small subunit [Pseudobacillus wudalianchiensis]|uniref:Terminase n=1 Tax=Pseudobacillus wudalianchiensis TaxID=1743143 RepID=A0A1B9ATQ3_9BACI|nr:phage terminase small subunit [Bacillus wudalianchiensis]OCA87305.1 hypothetical protein A8F95_08640 [Bacillus wudalianchiensis]